MHRKGVKGYVIPAPNTITGKYFYLKNEYFKILFDCFQNIQVIITKRILSQDSH